MHVLDTRLFAITIAVFCAAHIAAAPVVRPALASGLPLGDLVLTHDPDFVQLCAQVDADTFDVYLGARTDFATIDQAERNGSDGLVRWQAMLEFNGFELLDVELFGDGAVDAEAALQEFDVSLGSPLVGSNTFTPLARLRVSRAEWSGSGSIVVRGFPDSPFSGRPGWYSALPDEGCDVPCAREFRRAWVDRAAIQGIVPLGCYPDAHCGVVFDRPLGAEIWTVGASQLILYSTMVIGPARFDFSTDGGQSWSLLHFASDGQEGWFRWTVPAQAIGELRLRATDPCAMGGDDEITITVTDRTPIESTSWGAVKARF